MTNSSSRSTSPSPMNRYGAMAWDHWERYLPNRMATITDPVRFFRELGEFVAAEVTAEMQARLDPNADETEEVMVRREVEEELLAVHVLLPAETDENQIEDPDADLVAEYRVEFDDPIVARLRRSPVIEPGLWEPPPPE